MSVHARLTAAMRVAALLRRVAGEGGTGCVLHRGDETAGSILIATRARGTFTGYFERTLGADGYAWVRVGPADDSGEEASDWLARRRARDPDQWVVELDIPDAQRFAAESTGCD